MSRAGVFGMLTLLIGGAASLVLTWDPRPELSAQEVGARQRAEIAAVMETLADNGQFSGTILVAVRGEPVYEGAFGLADIERGVPNTDSTQFRIASATKPFTTLLVYQLVEAGKLRLDDKLSEWLPEFPAEKGAGITIEQLLAHRSGITGEGRIPELEEIERLRWTRASLLREIGDRDLVFAPGTAYEYSNYGFVLLGLIIERAGGASYAEQLRERILEPAGMTHTREDENDTIIPGRALGYHFDYLLGPQNAPYLDMSFTFGAGHLISTVADLSRFASSLDGPTVLPSRFREVFLRSRGWMLQTTPVGSTGRRVRGNYLSGSINGFASHMLRIEEDGIFIALLKNMKEPGAQIVVKWPEYVTSRILAILYGEPWDMPRRSAAFAVFEAIRDHGIEEGRGLYAGILASGEAEYYVDDEEFDRLAEVLPALGLVRGPG